MEKIWLWCCLEFGGDGVLDGASSVDFINARVWRMLQRRAALEMLPTRFLQPVAWLSVPREMNGLSVSEQKPQGDLYQQSGGVGQGTRDGTSKLNLSIASSPF